MIQDIMWIANKIDSQLSLPNVGPFHFHFNICLIPWISPADAMISED